MSDDPSDALVKVAAEKAGEEVGTILRPVANIVERLYGDALEPGMKEVGKLVKNSISLLGAPLEWVEGKKAQIIADSLRRVPEDRRTEVPVALLGPVLEGARYHDQGTPLYEMFAELLARGFDEQRQGEAHPAYVVVLGQLSPDEARLLELTSKDEVEKPRFNFALGCRSSSCRATSRINSMMSFISPEPRMIGVCSRCGKAMRCCTIPSR